MTVYGGFSPGTYQAWALNLLTSVFMSPGIARAMNVIQNTPAGMSVLVTVDPTAGDGLCYLPNGAFMRIDAQTTLSVPSNTSGSTRTDAVVAQVDPTGATSPSLSYVTNWTLGLTGGAVDQLVLALVAVPNNAVSITSGDITPTNQVANFAGAGNASSINNALFAVNNSATNVVSVFPQQPTASQEGFLIQVWNGSALVNLFAFGGNLGNPISFVDMSGYVNTQIVKFDPNSLNGETAGSLQIFGNKPGSGSGNADLYLSNPTPGWIYVQMSSGTAHFDQTAKYSGNVGGYSTTLLNNATTTGQKWYISGVQPTTGTVGDVWIRTDTTLS